MYNLSTKTHKGPSSQQRPTQAHKEGKRTICMFFLIMYFSFYFSFFILLAGFTTPTTPLFGVDDSHESPQRPQQPMKVDAGPQRWKTAHRSVFFYNVFFFAFQLIHAGPQRWKESRRGPTAANEGRRRPTKRENGSNDTSGIVRAIVGP